MILMPVAAFVALIMAASMRVKGPLWAMGAAWLVSLGPIVTGLLSFATLTDPGYSYSLVLIGLIGCYAGGAAAFHLLPRAPLVLRPERAGLPPLTIVWACWTIGLAGAGLVVADYLLLGGAGLSDLAALRDTYIEKTSASIYAQLGSVMTWACLYSYIFGLNYRHRLGRVRTAILLIPIGGYFLISLLSAGRQAAFQVMLTTVLTVATATKRRNLRNVHSAVAPPRSGLLIAGVSVAMIAYMGYIAVARNDGALSDDKTEVLLALFNFRMSAALKAVLDALGPSLRSTIVEGMTYFSSSIAIFQKSLLLDLPRGWGANTFPLFMRQVQGFTGIAPQVVLTNRTESLNALGVIGNGWTTAFAAIREDVGPVGAAVFLAMAGYYSSYAWRRALVSEHFEDLAIGIAVLLFAVYMPLSAALSDSNILLLWIFCLGLKALRPRPTAGHRLAVA